MKTQYNLKDIKTAKKFQNSWVAFNKSRDVIASSKSYIKLHDLIKNEKKGNVEVTFINAANSYLAPFNGSL